MQFNFMKIKMNQDAVHFSEDQDKAALLQQDGLRWSLRPRKPRHLQGCKSEMGAKPLYEIELLVKAFLWLQI